MCLRERQKKNAVSNHFENVHWKTHCIFHTFIQLKMDISHYVCVCLCLIWAYNESGGGFIFLCVDNIKHIVCVHCCAFVVIFPHFWFDGRLKWMALPMKDHRECVTTKLYATLSKSISKIEFFSICDFYISFA